MRFDEFPLYNAVAQVYEEIKRESGLRDHDTPSVRSEEWILNDARRRQLTRRIVSRMTEHDSDILSAFVRYAKASKNGADVPKLHLTIQVARVRGARCFYSMLGNCSNDVDLDRINAGGEYSLANCVIACGHHNRARGNMPIEQFLSGKEGD